MPISLMKSINITAPVCATSYGYVAQNLIKSLIKAGTKVSLRPIGNVQPDEECNYGEYISKCQSDMIEDALHIILWHQFDLKKYCIKGKVNVGFPIFELDQFNEREVENINECDQLIVCSGWAKSILEKYTSKPIHIVPLGADPDIFKIIPTEKTDKVRFINIGKWELRKNQLAVIRAFGELHEEMPDAVLTLVCYNDFVGEENEKWINLARRLIPPEKLNIFQGRLKSQVDINVILNNHDIGVFPSLAEGWNLEASEILLLNKHIIATYYSGHAQFLNSNNAELITIQETEEAFDGKWFYGNGRWAKFGAKQFKQLKELMLKTYWAVKYGIKGPKITTDEFIWDNSVKKLITGLEIYD